MKSLIEAVLFLIQLQGKGALFENRICDSLGLQGLMLHGSHEIRTAWASAKEILVDLLRTGSVTCTGKCQGESSRRKITPLEIGAYYIDIYTGELSWPRGGSASDFPKITGIRVGEAELRRKAAKVIPKTKANRVADCTNWLI
jgi:hypothetical protein